MSELLEDTVVSNLKNLSERIARNLRSYARRSGVADSCENRRAVRRTDAGIIEHNEPSGAYAV